MGSHVSRHPRSIIRANIELPSLLDLISCMNESLLKWKLCHHTELERWVKVRLHLPNIVNQYNSGIHTVHRGM